MTAPQTEIIQVIRRSLDPWGDVVDFAFLFGSAARGTLFPWSDLDLAIHFATPVDLLEQGRISAAVEQHTGRPVDLVELNRLPETRPRLAFEILSSGMLVVCHNPKALETFQHRTILHYLDTAPLRRWIDEAFHRRLGLRRDSP